MWDGSPAAGRCGDTPRWVVWFSGVSNEDNLRVPPRSQDGLEGFSQRFSKRTRFFLWFWDFRAADPLWKTPENIIVESMCFLYIIEKAKTDTIDNRCFRSFTLLNSNPTTLSHTKPDMYVSDFVRNPDEIPIIQFFQPTFSALEWLRNKIAPIVVYRSFSGIFYRFSDMMNSFWFLFVSFFLWNDGGIEPASRPAWCKASCHADDAN